MIQKLMTYALPYANGPLHLGHLLGGIEADIHTRFNRLKNIPCLFLCGDDAHGTGVMLAAQKNNENPEDLINRIYQEHVETFDRFGVHFDCYHTTHSPENKKRMEQIYGLLSKTDALTTKSIEQAFDAEQNMFLPDRFIKGTCPKCEAPDQYGDHCEKCGTTYAATDLINPKSILSDTAPETRQTEHVFFRLSQYQDFLATWLETARLQKPVANKLKEWFGQTLQDWDITRNAPYFGFNIPGHEDLYFYVWMDAPVGYLAALDHWAAKHKVDVSTWLEPNSPIEIIHAIGKDIVYFHGLFWPAVLQASGLKTPDQLHVHGFLTIEGQKMSKSRGIFITGSAYADHLDPETLRYYLASKLGGTMCDLDLNLTDLAQKINSDLVGKFVNIASRCAKLLHTHCEGTLCTADTSLPLLQLSQTLFVQVDQAYSDRDLAAAVRLLMQLADEVNGYLAEEAPWRLAKDPEQIPAMQQVCSNALSVFRDIAVGLKPITPDLIERAEAFLQTPDLNWSSLHEPLANHKLAPFSPLLERMQTPTLETFIPA
jgi:methionyl-tRNA synthetase